MSLLMLNNHKREDDISQYIDDLVIKSNHAGTMEKEDKKSENKIRFAEKKPVSHTPQTKSIDEEKEVEKLRRRGVYTINKNKRGQNKVTFRK